MLESMLSGTGSGGGAFGALQKLLKSGIPGLENLFGQNPDGSLKYAHKKFKLVIELIKFV